MIRNFTPYSPLLLVVILLGCATKPGSQSQSSGYAEDLTLYRPHYPDPIPDTMKYDVVEREEVKFVEPTLAITAELDTLLDSIASYSRSRGFYTVLTIQIYNGTSSEEANEAKATAYKEFPDLFPKLVYNQPIFRVTVGKYLERIDANKMLRDLKRVFPSATLIPERIYN